MTNTKSSSSVKADSVITDDKAKSKVSAGKLKATPKPASKVRTVKAKSNTTTRGKTPVKKSILTKKQSPRELLSNQHNDVADLNTGSGYPIHPERIWPD